MPKHLLSNMRKNTALLMNRILFIFFLILSHICMSQEFNAGAVIGLNTSQVSGDGLGGFNKVGLSIGGFINRKFNSLQAQMELKYVQKGSRELINEDTYNDGYKFQLNYIEVPLLIKKRIQKNTMGEIGFSFGQLLNWHESYNGIDENRIDVKKIEYSILIGLEYKITEKIYANTRISNSISPIRPHVSNQTYKWNKGQYNTSIAFSIYYEIR